ncbi:acyl-CoA dehydrogenase C-terminal domain-containing protein, partial [Streptococcus suis]
TSGKLSAIAPQLESALDATQEATRFLQDCIVKGDSQTALCGATPYQRLLSLTVGALYLTKAGLHDDRTAALAAFFAENTLQETAALKQVILNGAA